MWGREEMEESKKAPHLQVYIWEDGVSMTREGDARNTLTGVGRARVQSPVKTDPKGSQRSESHWSMRIRTQHSVYLVLPLPQFILCYHCLIAWRNRKVNFISKWRAYIKTVRNDLTASWISLALKPQWSFKCWKRYRPSPLGSIHLPRRVLSSQTIVTLLSHGDSGALI